MPRRLTGPADGGSAGHLVVRVACGEADGSLVAGAVVAPATAGSARSARAGAARVIRAGAIRVIRAGARPAGTRARRTRARSAGTRRRRGRRRGSGRRRRRGRRCRGGRRGRRRRRGRRGRRGRRRRRRRRGRRRGGAAPVIARLRAVASAVDAGRGGVVGGLACQLHRRGNGLGERVIAEQAERGWGDRDGRGEGERDALHGRSFLRVDCAGQVLPVSLHQGAAPTWAPTIGHWS